MGSTVPSSFGVYPVPNTGPLAAEELFRALQLLSWAVLEARQSHKEEITWLLLGAML